MCSRTYRRPLPVHEVAFLSISPKNKTEMTESLNVSTRRRLASPPNPCLKVVPNWGFYPVASEHPQAEVLTLSARRGICTRRARTILFDCVNLPNLDVTV